MINFIVLSCVTFAFSIATISLCFGLHVLDIFNLSWLQGAGDAFIHQLGWLAFTLSVWTIPIGTIEAGSYFPSTSVVFTDSIPLFAIIAKIFLFGPNIPIQYFGIWIFVCYALLFLCLVILFRSFSIATYPAILASALLALNPLMQFRMHYVLGTPALMGHFLIVMALILSRRDCDNRNAAYWIGLTVCSLATHAYLAAIIIFIWFFRLVHILYLRKDYLKSIFEFCFFATAVVFSSYFLGYFIPGVELTNTLKASVNTQLFNWWDPGNHNLGLWSSIVPFGRNGSSHPEAFLFPGIGILLMIIAGIICFFLTLIFNGKQIKTFPLYIYGAAFALFLFANYEVNYEQLILHFNLIDHKLFEPFFTLLSIFRVNARFAWLAFYLLPIISVVLIWNFLPNSKRVFIFSTILTALIITQVIDMQEGRNAVRNSLVTKNFKFQDKLQSTAWKELKNENIKELVVIPMHRYKGATSDWRFVWEIVGGFALFNGIQTNSFRVARRVNHQTFNYEALLEKINQDGKCDIAMVVDDTFIEKTQKKLSNEYKFESFDNYWLVRKKCLM